MWVRLFAAGLGMFALPTFTCRGEADHRWSHSVVQVRAMPGTGRIFYGSGVVVGPGRVVTNCHVTREARRIFVGKGPEQFPARSQRVDVSRDLCLLTVPGVSFPQAALGSSRTLKVGDPLYLYGYPLGLGIAFSQGSVKALHPYRSGHVIETSANFTLGASGGGIFDQAGRLVGVATFLTSGHAGGYYAIPSDWIRAVETSPARPVQPLGPALSFWEDAKALPAFLRPPSATVSAVAPRRH